MHTVPFSRPDGNKLNIEVIQYTAGALSRNRTPDRHRHAFHSLFFIESGKAVQEVDFEEYQLRANHLLFIPQGAVHWEKYGEQQKGFVVLFTDDFFTPLQKLF